MRIKHFILTAAILLAAFTAVLSDNSIIMEYGVMYGAVNSPGGLEDNTTGVYDSVCFDAKLGANLLSRWASVYAGGSFMFFPERQDSVKHYTFFPLYAGLRANIFPDMVIYPDFSFELGKSISNYHSKSVRFGIPYDIDRSYTGDYYNIGFGINWNMQDVSSISLRLERPSVAGSEEMGEIHFIKAGVAWKTYY